MSCRVFCIPKMESYQDCISHPFNPDQKENEWNVRWQMNYNKNGSCLLYHLDCKLWSNHILHKLQIRFKKKWKQLEMFFICFFKKKKILDWKIRKILFLFIRIFTFFKHFFRLNLIYLTLILHGIGTLMPWNMFVTAKEVRVVSKKVVQ